MGELHYVYRCEQYNINAVNDAAETVIIIQGTGLSVINTGRGGKKQFLLH